MKCPVLLHLAPWNDGITEVGKELQDEVQPLEGIWGSLQELCVSQDRLQEELGGAIPAPNWGGAVY